MFKRRFVVTSLVIIALLASAGLSSCGVWEELFNPANGHADEAD